MKELFGIPMTGIAVSLTALLVICLFTVAVIAKRKPVVLAMIEIIDSGSSEQAILF